MTFEECYEQFNLQMLPEHMHRAVYRYLDRGIPMGSFGTALMSNLLVESFGRADEDNLLAMQAWACWLYWHCPAGARGSAGKVRDWCPAGGLSGETEE